MNNEFIYHVISQKEWESIAKTKFYSPQSLLDEGFIHFSLKEQVPGVIERFYKDQTGLSVLKVEVNKIKSRLEFEMVPELGLFPHLYGKLNINSVIGIFPLIIKENNKVFWAE